MPNWREQFEDFQDEYLRYVSLGEGYPRTKRKFLDDLETFIQSKFAELIDSMPDQEIIKEDSKPVVAKVGLVNLKDQLRKEWLDSTKG